MPLTIYAAARTHVGLVRRRNEDSVYAGRWLFAVADGLGGHVAGDIASATAIDTLQRHDRQADPADLPDVLGRAVREVNDALRRKIETAAELAGMGTTLVAMLWSGASAALANVGDSRAYQLRDSHLVQITEDHTYDNLVSDAMTVPNLPDRMARFLDGRADGRSPDLTIRALQTGDKYLLCSDGLSAVVPAALVRDTMTSIDDASEAADRLVTLAIDLGGPDNITVIIVEVHDGLDTATASNG